MSTSSNFSSYGNEWEVREVTINDSYKDHIVVASSYDGYVDLSEQDLRDMLAELESKRG